MSEEFGLGEGTYGSAGFETECEEGTHDASEDGYSNALAEVVISLSSFRLLFRGDFVFLGPACGTVDRYCDKADQNSEEDDLSGGLVDDGVDRTIVDGWDESAEGGAEAQSDGVTKSDAEVADGETEGKAADSPKRTPEERVEDAGARGSVKDGEEIGDEKQG